MSFLVFAIDVREEDLDVLGDPLRTHELNFLASLIMFGHIKFCARLNILINENFLKEIFDIFLIQENTSYD